MIRGDGATICSLTHVPRNKFKPTYLVGNNVIKLLSYVRDEHCQKTKVKNETNPVKSSLILCLLSDTVLCSLCAVSLL